MIFELKNVSVRGKVYHLHHAISLLYKCEEFFISLLSKNLHIFQSIMNMEAQSRITAINLFQSHKSLQVKLSLIVRPRGVVKK